MISEKWCTELLTIERKSLQLESFFGLEENALKISSHEVIKKSLLFERSEFKLFQRSVMKFSILFPALIFLLRFWIKPKMKGLSGQRTYSNKISF